MTREEMEAFERVRERAVKRAMAAADGVILSECRGNPEALMLLTAEVSLAFADKTVLMLQAETYKKQMLCEVPPEVLNLKAITEAGQ